MTRDTNWTDIGLKLLALLGVFAAANAVTYLTSGYFEKQSNYRSLVANIHDHPQAHVLFVGDSHTAHPLNAYLDEQPAGAGYSVAFGGDSVRESFAKFRRALQLAPRIDTLVISAEPHMLGKGRLESSNRSFADWYFIAARDRTGLRTGWPSSLLDQVPLLNDDFLQYLRKAITTRPVRRRGSTAPGPVAPDWETLPESTRTLKAKTVGTMDHQEVGEHAEPYLWYSRILELARARGIRVIGVRYPVHPEYAASVDAATIDKFDHFLLERGVAQIVDLRTLFADPAAFDDPDHVKLSQAPALLQAIERATGVRLSGAMPAPPAGES